MLGRFAAGVWSAGRRMPGLDDDVHVPDRGGLSRGSLRSRLRDSMRSHGVLHDRSGLCRGSVLRLTVRFRVLCLTADLRAGRKRKEDVRHALRPERRMPAADAAAGVLRASAGRWRRLHGCTDGARVPVQRERRVQHQLLLARHAEGSRRSLRLLSVQWGGVRGLQWWAGLCDRRFRLLAGPVRKRLLHEVLLRRQRLRDDRGLLQPHRHLLECRKGMRGRRGLHAVPVTKRPALPRARSACYRPPR